MTNKYTIDVRQFNSGEDGKITFPTFEQCLMYGLHKLKRAILQRHSITRAILFEDPHGRKIVVSPSEEELRNLIVIKPQHQSPFKIKTTLDGDDLDIIL